MAETPQSMTPIRVWDLPTRVFHWALVVIVIALVITGNVGGNAMVGHVKLGLAAGALLLFRLVWGLVGGRWSRFTSFVRSPATIVRYLKGELREGEHLDVGHNPLGALSVLALLGLLCLQVATGLVADDEIATTGPLNRFVSSAVARIASGWHTEVGKALLIVLVLLHVGAIVYYKRRKQIDLITPMVRGDKALPAGTPASADTLATRGLALAVLAAFAAGAVWIYSLG